MPIGLRVGSSAFLAAWCLIAAFPIFWIAVMSFKEPVDAFSSNPFHVIFGPSTLNSGKGLAILDIAAGIATIYAIYKFSTTRLPNLVRRYSPFGQLALGWIAGALAVGVASIVFLFGVLPPVLSAINGVLGPLGRPVIGLTAEHYEAVWVVHDFYRNFLNSLWVTSGVVIVSLTVGTLAGYGLARSGSSLAFWILVVALIFRALPHSVLVAGYLPFFINSAAILEPVLGDAAPTLYGQPLAVIAVLVSINQPFTIWMLRSFFSEHSCGAR